MRACLCACMRAKCCLYVCLYVYVWLRVCVLACVRMVACMCACVAGCVYVCLYVVYRLQRFVVLETTDLASMNKAISILKPVICHTCRTSDSCLILCLKWLNILRCHWLQNELFCESVEMFYIHRERDEKKKF